MVLRILVLRVWRDLFREVSSKEIDYPIEVVQKQDCEGDQERKACCR